MVSTQDKEDVMRKAFQARMASAKQEEESASSTPSIKTKRELPSIPGGRSMFESYYDFVLIPIY